jgi:uncharacterized protein YjbJ (UPF0337 family)
MTQSPGPGDPPVDLTAGTTSAGYTTTTTELPSVTPSGSTGAHGTRDTTEVAKQEGRHVKESAAGAASDVAGTAKEQAGQVAGEARRQAKDLLHEGRSQLQEQAAQQQQRAAAGLRSLQDELRSMAQHSSQPGSQQGVAGDLAHQAADRAGSLASWLEGRDPGALLDEVRGFARQRPLAFLALAAGAGVVAGRLGRGLQADAEGDSSSSRTGVGGTVSTYPTSGAMATEAGPLGVVPPAVPSSTAPVTSTGTNRPYDTGGGV